jgi:outer membrane protein TolC
VIVNTVHPVRGARPCTFLLRTVLGVCVLAASSPTLALQPLEAFLSGARTASTRNRQAELTATAREAEAAQAFGSALPAVSASGSLTHASYPGVQPSVELDAQVALKVPLVNLGIWAKTSASRATARAARAGADATGLEVERQVAQAYYQLVGAEALRRADEKSLAAARENLSSVRAKRAEGAATEVDVERAVAQLESVQQDVASAELTDTLARRSLTTLTGIVPQGAAAEPADDLHGEASLQAWEARAGLEVPSVARAAEERTSADVLVRASRFALLPSLDATATANATNATALYGGSRTFTTVGATLSWSFDLGTPPGIRSVRAQADAARAAEQLARDDARDAIHQAWQQVKTGIAKARSARAQTQAATLASDLAAERYAAGMGTQLEVIQAQRDLLTAEATRIQADADLAFARASLRLAAGLSATAELAAEGTQP